jgi:hypothetical protein
MATIQPKWTGGFSTSVRYKDFRLGASFDYMIGGQFGNMDKSYGLKAPEWLASYIIWKNANGVNIREGITKGGGIPVHGVDVDGNAVDCYMNANQYFSYRSTYDLDGCIYSRTYIKLREVSLMYNIPAAFLAKANIGTLTSKRIAFIATNPWLIHSAMSERRPIRSWFKHGWKEVRLLLLVSYGVTVKLTF